MIGLQDQFCDYMFQQAVKNDWKSITENKSKFLLVSMQVHAPFLGPFYHILVSRLTLAGG